MFAYRKQSRFIKGFVILWLLTLLPFSSFVRTADAAVVPVTGNQLLNTDGQISTLRIDNARGYLYALSRTTNELLFIQLDTFQIKKRLPVGSAPLGIDIVDTKMYIALSGSTFIAVVDLDQQVVSSMISVADTPGQVAVDGNNLFYASYDQWVEIHKKDLTTGADVIIEKSIYEPQLVVDREAHKLYAGETGISRYKVNAYSSIDGSPLWTLSPEQGGYANNMLLANGQLYYGSLQIDPNTQQIISTTSTGEVLAVLDGFLFTRTAILSGIDGTVVAKYNDAPLLAVDSSHNLYMLDDYLHNSIYKRSVVLPANNVPISYENGNNLITTDQALTAFAVGANDHYLYAVSNSANRLLQIDSDTMQVVADRFIGSQPTDVDIRDGILYVSLGGSTHLAKIDTQNETNFMAPIVEIPTVSITSNVAAGIGNVYYMDPTSFGYLHKYDTADTTYPGMYYGAGLVTSPDGSKLYVGESGSTGSKLHQINTSSGAVAQQSAAYYEGTSVIIQDGSYIYYGSRRLDANDLSLVYGQYKNDYYSAQLLAARGENVIATNGVYNRDTFNLVYRFPVPVMYGYIKTDGSILLLTSNRSSTNPQYSLRKYSSLAEMDTINNEDIRPESAYFYDVDILKKHVQGTLTFYPGSSGEIVRDYDISFYNAANQPISGMRQYTVFTNMKQPDGSFTIDINQDITDDTVKIGITPYVENDYGQRVKMDKSQLFIRLWDYPMYNPSSITIEDNDASPDLMGGTVTIGSAPGEIAGDRYDLYFYGEEGVIGDAIGSVAAARQSSYSFTIPIHTAVPDGAIALAVQLVDQDGEGAPDALLESIPGRMTPIPDTDQITVVNGVGATDSVRVAGLQSGDIVKVYDISFETIGQGTVASGQTSVSITNLQLDSQYPIILVAVTRPGQHESFYVAVWYDDEGNTNSNGGNTGPTTGGIGGGDPPAVFVPPAAAAAAAPSLVQSDLVHNTDGSVQATVTLNNDALDSELAKWDEKSHTLAIRIEDEADQLTVKLSGDQLTKLLSKNKDGVIEIQGTQAGFVIPASVLDASGKIDPTTTYTLRVEPVDSATADSIHKLMSNSSLNPVGPSYSFTITQESTKGSSTEIHNTNVYIGHVITVDSANVPVESLAAVMVDPATGSITPVPAAFKQENGHITATIFRKGNSVYSLVSQNKSFSDVTNAHFAYNAIGSLSNRMVINGYEDGTFKPESLVTRAEAASMLVKALGIVPSVGAAPLNFKDVTDNAWYYGAVSAAVDAGLLKGYTDGTFRPNQLITQQEMVAIMYQALLYGGYTPPKSVELERFNRIANYSAWSAEAVDAVLKADIMKQSDVFTIKASKSTTRAECAELLYRMLTVLELN